MKIKKIIKSYSISGIKKAVNDMEYDITTKTILLYMLSLVIIPIIAGLILRLKLIYIAIASIIYLFTLPLVIKLKYKFDYERNRFNSVTDYIERMIYSYRKNGKIYASLIDVRDASKGKLKKVINNAITFIDEGKINNSQLSLYNEAFKIIEKEYPCTRLITLHNYLEDVELNGGEYDNTLNIILEDVRGWSIRTSNYRVGRKNVKGKVVLSILLAVITSFFTLNMIPAEYTYKIIPNLSYQIMTTINLIMYIILYLITLSMVGKTYLDIEEDEVMDEGNPYKRALDRKEKFITNKKKKTIQSVIIGILGISCAVISSVIIKNKLISIPVLFITLMIIIQPFYTYKNDIKKISKEIKTKYPEWIRNLIIQLQTNNVSISIQRSLKTCPYAIKHEVEKLLEGIDKNPGNREPFDNFCKDHDLPTLKRSIDYLYYITIYGSTEQQTQLDYLIEQNNYMIEEEEKIKNDDSLSVISLLILAPMIISMAKIILDMYSLFLVFENVIFF